MAGIYIHIPFCKQRCHYCDFYFLTNTRREYDFVSALKLEIKSRRNFEYPIETIYFGGGTPSIIQPRFIDEILTTIRQHFEVTEEAEITLEANPDDLSEDNLGAYYTAGINRLSIGIQSFDDQFLQWMNRSHNAHQAITVIERASKVGFSDFSIDLIYGLPGMNESMWMKQLEIVASLPVNHLSCYCLTVEPKTQLDKFIQTKKYQAPDEEMQAKHFISLMKMAPEFGFEQYEISNFARQGHYSRHNSAYWNYKPYLGFGPSAHSFDGTNRSHHLPSLSTYITNPLEQVQEILNENERFNEYILIGLRTAKGIDSKQIKERFSTDIYDCFEKALTHNSSEINYTNINGIIQLTEQGKLYADSVASSFFLSTD